MTSNEKYRELIIRMVNEIHNNVWVKRIFAIVHHSIFANEARRCYIVTDREKINRILDKQSDRVVREIYVFVAAYTGETEQDNERED